MTVDILVSLRDWQHVKQQQALEAMGTQEAAEYLAESKRYGACADEIQKLRDHIAELRKLVSEVAIYRARSAMPRSMPTTLRCKT